MTGSETRMSQTSSSDDLSQDLRLLAEAESGETPRKEVRVVPVKKWAIVFRAFEPVKGITDDFQPLGGFSGFYLKPNEL